MNRKMGVDPTDFLMLRSELIEMKARLDESEQARAIVEARLELARRGSVHLLDRAQRDQRSCRHGHPAAAADRRRSSAGAASPEGGADRARTTNCLPRSMRSTTGSSASRITPPRSPSSNHRSRNCTPSSTRQLRQPQRRQSIRPDQQRTRSGDTRTNRRSATAHQRSRSDPPPHGRDRPLQATHGRDRSTAPARGRCRAVASTVR